MIGSNSSNLKVKDLSFINDIKSMAVIGPSEKRNFFFLRNHLDAFKGPIYAINPTIKEIPGFPTENIYPSVRDIPGELDFAFIAVPKEKILDVIDDCVAKKVKLVSIFTADFSDAGTDEGVKLELELLRRANNTVRFLGPNGMGLFYPKKGIQWRAKFPTVAGNIGFVAQSGGICNIAIYTAKELGFHFSKVFSYGNGTDLDAVDLIYFLDNDPETEIILIYIEGIKKGRGKEFLKVIANTKKPIVILKGGKSNIGSKAARTHTASIAGNTKIWKSVFKQENVMEVNSLEQLLHLAHLIDCYGIRKIENIVVFSISGGYGVVLADLLEEAGLKMPNFTPKIQEKLDALFFIPGTSSKNPLDVAAQLFHGDSIKKIIDVALSDEKMDCLVMDLPSYYFDHKYYFSPTQNVEEIMIETLCLGHKHNKPLIPIIQRTHTPEARRQVAKILATKKVPIFGDPMEVIPLLPKISEHYIKKSQKT
ncbi:MAG: CoA-binding protein [Candidatus Hermodarchaeota archaeon]